MERELKCVYVPHVYICMKLLIVRMCVCVCVCVCMMLGKAGGRIGFSTSDSCQENVCQIWVKELSNGSLAVALYNAVC